MPLLAAHGYETTVTLDVWQDRAFAAAMIDSMDRWQIPAALRGHLAVFIEDRISLQGHLPLPLVASVLRAADGEQLPPRLLVSVSEDTDNMHDRAGSMTFWDFAGPPQDHPIEATVAAFLADRLTLPEQTGGGPAAGHRLPGPEAAITPSDRLLPLVVGAGFLDGVNPCALAALLFFTAFLFAARHARVRVRTLATAYVGTALLVYFAIGLGVIGSVQVFTQGHLVGKVAAGLTVGIGLLGLLAWVRPGLKLPAPRMSQGQWQRIKTFLLRATVPATAAGAVLVTLCTLPCSGFMYISILALLGSETAGSQGLIYLSLYNLAYITPLALVAVGMSNRHTARALAQWERKYHRNLHLLSSLFMVLVGMLIWLSMA